MIIEAFLNVIRYILRGIIAIMPTLPKIEYGSLDGVFQALSMTDLLVDIRILAACLAVLFALSVVELIWGIIMWVIRKIPTVE